MKALKVRVVGKDREGKNIYPNFDTLQAVKDENLPATGRYKWNTYLKLFGVHMYDSTSDINTVSPDSPKGTHLMLLLLPDAFVDQAETTFPDTCSVLSKAAAETFYEEKISIDWPPVIMDKAVIDVIIAKKQLGITLTPADEDAIDPASPARGLRMSPVKRYNAMLITYGIEVE